MTIDGINISTFGLQYSRCDGLLDSPKRKIILDEPGFTEKDIVFESSEISVELVGIYATKTDLLAGVEGLKTLIKTTLKHDFVLPLHLFTITGVVATGISVTTVSSMAKVYFRIKITD